MEVSYLDTRSACSLLCLFLLLEVGSDEGFDAGWSAGLFKEGVIDSDGSFDFDICWEGVWSEGVGWERIWDDGWFWGGEGDIDWDCGWDIGYEDFGWTWEVGKGSDWEGSLEGILTGVGWWREVDEVGSCIGLESFCGAGWFNVFEGIGWFNVFEGIGWFMISLEGELPLVFTGIGFTSAFSNLEGFNFDWGTCFLSI